MSQKGGARALLRALRSVLAGAADERAGAGAGETGRGRKGQQRLDTIVRLVASNLVAEVCSIYLKRDPRTLELCATRGLRPESVHAVRLRVGQGLVGRIAERAEPLATEDAQSTPGFRYLPETGEERFRSFVGVPIQRLGEVMGVLVVQNEAARTYTEDEIEALETVAMVIAEMAEAGAFMGSDGMTAAGRRVGPVMIAGTAASDGVVEGVVHLHEPRLVLFQPIAEDVGAERRRLGGAMEALRGEIDGMVHDGSGLGLEHREVIEVYRMFAYDKGWLRRLEEAVESGLSAEVAVEKTQSEARARMERSADPYLRERLHDLDDLAHRLIRHLIGDDHDRPELPENAVLVARALGAAELIGNAGRIRAVVLEEGSVSGHAAIVARALAIPMVVQAERITRDANAGDRVVVDGETGRVHLRPDDDVAGAFREKIALVEQAREVYRTLVGKPATSRDGTTIRLRMNAGIRSDLPSLGRSGADGVGLFRTELQFMIRRSLPLRDEQSALYGHVLDMAEGREVVFRTLDIGSDKILPYINRRDEPNPAMGWRAIRVGLDRPHLFRMQLQALIRGANGRPLSVMFPMVSEAWEFYAARDLLLGEADRLERLGHPRPQPLRIGFMLETPSLAHAPDRLFREADFVSVGGNDLMQFFFAADRENERVRRRYEALSLPFLDLLGSIAGRCAALGVSLSFCGEAAGRPLEAVALAALGYRELSMRPAAIGPVKQMIREVDLGEVRAVLDEARAAEAVSARPALQEWSEERGLPV
ncbi:MAG TPA: putative PEP-binding protein [Thermohalobaculum sp.]|nr:putative PEP-binding protein [Thermohalobaculum sp.]